MAEETEQLELRDYLTVLQRRRWIVIEVFVVLVAVVAIGSYVQTPVYRATAKLLVETQAPPRYSHYEELPLVAAGLEITRARSLETHKALIKTRPVIEAVIRQLHLDEEPEELLKQLTVETLRDTDVISIHADDPDPQLAANIANSVAENYVLLNQSYTQESAHSASTFLESQLNKVRVELADAEDALEAFKAKTGIVDLAEETKQEINVLGTLQAQLASAGADARAASARADVTRRKLSEQERMKLSATVQKANPVVEELQTELAKLETQRAGLLEEYSEDSQKVAAVEAQIDQIKTQLADALKVVLASTTESTNPVYDALLEQAAMDQADAEAAARRLSALRGAVNRHEARLLDLPVKEKNLARLVRQQTVSDRIYKLLLEKYHEARIAEAMSLSAARLVEPATVPKSPVKPRKKLNIALACVFGLLLGIMLAALVEYLDDTIKDVDDVRRYLHLPVLGSVPRFRAPELTLISDLGERSSAAEAYRVLRSNITFASVDQPVKTLLVTAATQLEGKTTTVANLGIAMSQEGKKVLLVDTDLRRPALHRMFDLDNTRGLTSTLVGSFALEDVIQPTEIENLSVLTSGPLPPNPAELLNSAKMRELLSELQDQWDIILFDSPPTIMAADAAILASITDGVLFVIEQHNASRRIIAEAINVLQSAKARLLGVALNKWRAEGRGYYYYYYYYYGSEQE